MSVISLEMGLASRREACPAAEMPRLRLPDERPGDGFHEPARRQCPARPEDALLAGGQHGAGDACVARERRGRDAVGAGQPDDFLDKVGRAMSIGPPGGRRYAERGGFPFDHTAELFERGDNFRVRKLCARQLLDARRVECDDRRSMRLFSGYDGVAGFAAAEFEDHLRCEVEPQHFGLRIDAPLEPIA